MSLVRFFKSWIEGYFSLPLYLLVGYTYPNIIQYYFNNANALSLVAFGIVSTGKTVA